MANIIKRVWNQNRMVQIEDLRGMTFQAEAAGHTFQISGIDDDGNTVALTGTPSGVLLRPDNTDVALTCSVSGGVVSATLPANCYDVPGRFGLTIFITSGSSKTAIYAAVGTVTRTSSDTVAPGTSQSVVDLINAINAAVNSIPASYSALLADIAPTYSDSALYSVGQYAWYDGDLKRCIVPITTAESYTAAHWTSAVLGQDVSDLKSAFKHEIGDYGNLELTPDTLFGTSVLRKLFSIPLVSGQKYRVRVTYTPPGWTFKKLTVYGYTNSYVLQCTVDAIGKFFEFTADGNYTNLYYYMEFVDGGTGTLFAETQFSAFNDQKTITNDLYNLEGEYNELSNVVRTPDEIKSILTGNQSEVGNPSNTHSYSARANALVWGYTIENAIECEYIKIYALANSTYKIGLGIKTDNSFEVTHVCDVASSTARYLTVKTNFVLDHTKKYNVFAFVSAGSIGFGVDSTLSTKYYTFDGSSGIDVEDTFTLTTQNNGISLGYVGLLYYVQGNIAIEKATPKNVVTVAKSGGMYNTIMGAVNAIADDSATNPYTIMIYPGIYDEVVNIGAGRFVSLVGINRDTCIIRDTSGKYANSPVLVNGNFTIENLTVIANHDNAGSWYPTWDGGNTTFASYCLHVDGGSFTSDAPAYGRIANCRLYSECNHAIGMGLRNYETVSIENCEIIRKASGDYINSNYLGAMGCHSQNPGPEEEEEHLIIKDCYIENAQFIALQLWKLQATASPMDLLAIGNTLVDSNGIGNVYFKNYQTTENRMIKVGSHGNNATELNH